MYVHWTSVDVCFYQNYFSFGNFLTGAAGAEKERARGKEKKRGREVTEEGNGEKEKDRGAPKVCNNCIYLD